MGIAQKRKRSILITTFFFNFLFFYFFFCFIMQEIIDRVVWAIDCNYVSLKSLLYVDGNNDEKGLGSTNNNNNNNNNTSNNNTRFDRSTSVTSQSNSVKYNCLAIGK